MDERLAKVLARAGAYLEDDDLCGLEQILEEASAVVMPRKLKPLAKPKKVKEKS